MVLAVELDSQTPVVAHERQGIGGLDSIPFRERKGVPPATGDRGLRAVKRYRDIADPSLAKALSHPLRTHVLAALEHRTASPSELAAEFGVSLGVVSYHVRRLHALGFLRLVKQVPRRGATEHYYTTVAGPRISHEAWASTPAVVKHAVVTALLAEVGAQASAAAGAGGFGARDAHLSRTPLTVDAQGWKELTAELDGLIARVEEIEAESHERLKRGEDGRGQPASVVLMLFHTPMTLPPAEPHAPAKTRRRRAVRV